MPKCDCCGFEAGATYPICEMCGFYNETFTDAPTPNDIKELQESIKEHRKSARYLSSKAHAIEVEEEKRPALKKQQEAEDKARKEREEAECRRHEEELKEQQRKEEEQKQREEVSKKSQAGPKKTLTNVCLVTYKYGWSIAESKFELQKSNETQIAVELKNNDEILWSSQTIGQYLPDGQDFVPLEVTFVVDGKKYSEKCSVKPVKSDDYWHLGVKLTKDYQLIFYLGAKKGDPNAEMSSPINLQKLLS